MSRRVPSDLKQRGRVVRKAAARIRRGGAPPRDPQLARLARAHLRNRAIYNARRKRVRDLAARIRRGLHPRASKDLLAAARRWLRYRKEYNAERRTARAYSTRRPGRGREGASGERASRVTGGGREWRKTRSRQRARTKGRTGGVRADVVRLARKGVWVSEIARIVDRSRFRIYQILDSEGYTRRP